MSKKYRVISNNGYEHYYRLYELKVGDIITKVDGSTKDDLYELPKHLHGRGHKGEPFDRHLNLKKPNYFYISEEHLEEIKEDDK